MAGPKGLPLSSPLAFRGQVTELVAARGVRQVGPAIDGTGQNVRRLSIVAKLEQHIEDRNQHGK
jgi:hypothetical protein